MGWVRCELMNYNVLWMNIYVLLYNKYKFICFCKYKIEEMSINERIDEGL